MGRLAQRAGPRAFALPAFVVALAAAPCAPGAAAAAAADVPPAARVDLPLPLDPTFADPRWNDAWRYANFTNLGTKRPAPAATLAALFYDDANLYVGFRVEQRAPLAASQRSNNVGFGADDFVGIGIDTSGNGEQAYFFEATPAGTRYQQASESARYVPDWSAAGTRTERGWNAMLIVPLRALRISGAGEQRWRINFLRATAATNEHDTWAFNPLMGDDRVPAWPTFFDARYWRPLGGVALKRAATRARPKGEAFGLASVGADHATFVDPLGNQTHRKARNAGIDLAYPITPTVDAVAALEPDFSSVEVDQQTIAPQQFQRNLTEYRPFFARGATYVNAARTGFEFNLANDRIFYSPAIGGFDRGLKVEGTSGIRSFGILEAKGEDAEQGTRFDDVAYGFLHRRTNNTLAMWSDGVSAHHSGANDLTYEVGAFGRSLASGLVYAAQYGRESGTRVTRAGAAQQMRAFVDIQRTGFEGAVSYQDIGPQYRPIDGFTNVADVRGPDAFADWTRTFSAQSHIKNMELFVNADRWTDRSGAVHAADADVFLTVRTQRAQRYVLSDSNGSLRDYGGDAYSGYPNGYANAVSHPFSLKGFEAHVGEGTPRSLDATWQAGPFGTFFLTALTTTVATQFGAGRTLAFDYAGTRERPFSNGVPDAQWLRRLSFSVPLGTGGSASLSYRVISGNGGFALPGRNLALGLRRRFASGNELFVNYGTPAANRTLDRLIVKYLIRFNGGL